jgi:PhzF family phenazine biosynthesis protein
MNVKLYQVDAFTEQVFGGNPAGVCPLIHDWLDDGLMQNIAMENNLAETAFYIEKNGQYFIRWFTPTVEVDLCGHGTLATAHVMFHHERYKSNDIVFESRSGKLFVRKEGEYITLNFPADEIRKIDMEESMVDCFGTKPHQIYKGKTDYLFVYKSENEIQDMRFDLDKIAKLDARGAIITAPGKDVDFVSRFFAPQSGVNEDPVTGSAHTTLVPYWRKVLGKDSLTAMQLSKRKGELKCNYLKDRVEISGKAKTYLSGEIVI